MYQCYQNSSLSAITFDQLIGIADQFDVSLVLNSNDYPDKYGKFEWVAAYGVEKELEANESSFEKLAVFINENSWVFGGLSYDLKNQLENLSSRHPNPIGFPEMYFFAPRYILLKERDTQKVKLWSSSKMSIKQLDELLSCSLIENQSVSQAVNLRPRIEKSAYLDKIKALQRHIQLGNIYEVNFCQEFYDDEALIEPSQVMRTLNSQSPMPFATFFKWNSVYLMGATPERFLCKRGEKIIAQPIKGTARRGKTEVEDIQIKSNLKTDLKEQNENVMIVDLMRNDLSKIAKRGSVEVEELFGIYTFPQVHQMISTVVADVSIDYSSLEVIQAAFPMGSMTGAPKVRAMELIDELEESRRGWYSGSVGYFSPEGDFDFNVIIRSLQYNASTHYLSLTVGGAITAKADADKEYQECLLKAKAVFNVLKQD